MKDFNKPNRQKKLNLQSNFWVLILVIFSLAGEAQVSAPPRDAPPEGPPEVAKSTTFETHIIRNSAKEYNKITHQYEYEYLNPELKLFCSYCDNFSVETKVVVQGDQSTGFKPVVTSISKIPYSIKKFRWEIKSLENDFREVKEIQNNGDPAQQFKSLCEVKLSLPSDGLYEVKLIIQHATRQEIKVKKVMVHHYYIGIMGDSFASGEGNPEGFLSSGLVQEGICESATATLTIDGLINKLSGGSDYSWGTASWMEPLAHRSRRSGFYTGVKKLGNQEWKRNGVYHLLEPTIIFLPTSGAKIDDGLINKQHTWQGLGQVQEMKRILGNKKLDALIISIGGNDLGFGPVLNTSVIKYLKEGNVQELKNRLLELPQKYQTLKSQIEFLLNVDPSDIFMVGYPIGLFSDDDKKSHETCGIFEFLNFDIDLDLGKVTLDEISLVSIENYEINLLIHFGNELNKTIQKTCSLNGWNYISNISNEFWGHGYCANQTYFIGATESCENQGDFMGTMHPNPDGHEVYKKLIFKSLVRHFKK